ncbi:MAG: hypothetical protein ACK40G_14850 [Cytophagaceae bacterium]
MFRIIFFLSYLFFTQISPVLSQDYNLFNSNRKYLYTGNNKYYSVEFENKIINDQDTTLIVFSNVPYGYPLNCTPLAGNKIIKFYNGKTVMFNEMKDSIFINVNAKLNDFWKLYTFSNGNYFKATVIDKVKENILGEEDSLKYIGLELYDVDNSLISDDYPIIKISKNHGLISSPVFFLLPEITGIVELCGIENPDKGFEGLKNRHAYDFEIGDEFHYYYDYYNNTEKNHLTRKRWIIKKVIEKEITAHTIKYKFEYKEKYTYSYLIIPTPPPPDPSYHSSTTYSIGTENFDIEKDLHPENVALNIPLLVSGQYMKWANLSTNSNYFNRFVKTIDKNDQNGSYITEIGEGIGFIKYENFPNVPFYYIKEINQLVYYKKGDEEWGTPINQSEVLNAEAPSIFKESKVYVSGSQFYYSEDTAYNLDLYNLEGKLIASYNNIVGSVSLSGLNSSVYTYILTTKGQSSRGSFVLAK